MTDAAERAYQAYRLRTTGEVPILNQERAMAALDQVVALRAANCLAKNLTVSAFREDVGQQLTERRRQSQRLTRSMSIGAREPVAPSHGGEGEEEEPVRRLSA